MSSITIYHNPVCGTSRNVLALIRNSGEEPTVIEYLKTPPSRDELAAVLARLGMKAEDIVRKGEDIYKSDYKGRSLSEDEWLDALVARQGA